jgi:hypothetical protein
MALCLDFTERLGSEVYSHIHIPTSYHVILNLDCAV